VVAESQVLGLGAAAGGDLAWIGYKGMTVMHFVSPPSRA
jgi:hypothetical protein